MADTFGVYKCRTEGCALGAGVEGVAFQQKRMPKPKTATGFCWKHTSPEAVVAAEKLATKAARTKDPQAYLAKHAEKTRVARTPVKRPERKEAAKAPRVKATKKSAA